MEPTPAKVKEVGVTAMVSMEETPLNCPVVVTFNPPLEVKAKVPVVLPIETLLVPVPKETAPSPFRVNAPED